MQIDLRIRAAHGIMLVLLALTVLGSRPTLAEVTFAGNGTVGGMTFVDVQTAATFEAGGSTADVVVGIDSPFAGGVFIDGTAPSPAPLFSTTVVLGQNAGSVGAADLTDLAALWDIDTLTVGSAGQGLIDISNSAAINADTAIVGDLVNGNGLVGVNGLGSRFVAIDLTVGDEGQGTFVIEDRALLFTTGTTLIGATLAQGNGSVQLAGSGTQWSAVGPVTIGGAAISSYGTLRIADGATAQVEDTTIINPLGRVELAGGGTLRNIGTVTLDNGGVISGDGFIQSDLTNSGIGRLSNFGTSPLDREMLVVTGVVTNDSTIFSERGHMRFASAVTNNLELISRGAFMEFNGGLTNNGDIVLGGDTTLHTIGTLLSPGDIHVLADSEATIVGDLTFTGASVVGLAVGEAAGTIDVIGTLDLGGATLELDYSAGVASQEFDSYQILGSTDPITTTFSNTQALADGRLWDIIYNTTSIFVTATGATVAPSSADFDQDGDVDGADFLDWQRGFGTPAPTATKSDGDANLDLMVDGADLVIWESEYGTNVGPITALTAVPEPSAALLALLALTLASSRRSGC